MGLTRSALSGIGLAAILLSGCKEIAAPKTVIKEGDVSGRVLWDPNKDGIYEGSPYALVTLARTLYSITGSDGSNKSWFRCGSNNMCTTTDSAGYFLLRNVSEGNREFYMLNFPRSDVIDAAYSTDRASEIKSNQINNLGDVRIEETNIIK